MYTIQLSKFQFQSKENIQPLIDQLITLATLSGCKVRYGNFNALTIRVFHLFISNQKQKIIIKFFVDYHSNIIRTIQIQKMNLETLISEIEEANINFHQLLKPLIKLF